MFSSAWKMYWRKPSVFMALVCLRSMISSKLYIYSLLTDRTAFLRKVFDDPLTGQDAAERAAAVHDGDEVLVQRGGDDLFGGGVYGQGGAEVAPLPMYCSRSLRTGMAV